MSDTAVFTFGRMNPPTIGHEKLADKVRAVARLVGGDPLIYLSHSQDKKKNPLDYNAKIKYAQAAFGKIVVRTKAKTIIEVLKELEKKGYNNIVLVVGSDRVASMEKLVKQYNQKEYYFDEIAVKSAGDRDPDADGVDGMSASKMREFVKNEDLDSFELGLPNGLRSQASKVFADVQKGMK